MSGNRFFPRPSEKKKQHMRSGKTAKQMERHLKGVANHHRMEIIFQIASEDGMSVEAISSKLQCNFKTVSEHLRRLYLAGLIEKRYKGRLVVHSLSPYGRIFMNFLTSFQHS
jgi:DNA-binding MarR family transcriptional regulator